MKQVKWFDSCDGNVITNRFVNGAQDNAKIDYFIKYHLRPSSSWHNPRFWIEHLCCYISHIELEQKLLHLGYVKNKDGLYKIELHNVFCVDSKKELPSSEEIVSKHSLYINSRNVLLHPFPYEI